MSKTLKKGRVHPKILTVTLNPAVDETLSFKHLKTKKSLVCDKAELSAGGKGINVARTLKGMGVQALATGLVGGNTGKFILKELNREGIKHKFVKIKNSTRTNLTLINKKTEKTVRHIAKGPRILTKEVKEFKSAFQKMLKTCDMVILSGRNANSVSSGIYKDLITLAHAYNVNVILDSHGVALARGIKAKPFCIKPNLKEAEAILKTKLNSLSKVKKAATDLQKRGAQNVIISLGAKGALGAFGPEIFLAEPPKTLKTNTVGCGDALVGGFVFGIQKTKSLKEALKWGVAAGNINASKLVPGKISKLEVTRRVKRVRVRKIV